MAAPMNLRYVVITSVNRDDLPDGGSAHFAETVRQVRRALPDARVEVLTPDFCGDLRCRGARAGRRPARLQSQHGDGAAAVPPGAPAGRLSAVARRAGFRAPSMLAACSPRSGFMVGLGETEDEVRCAARAICAPREPTWPPSANTCNPRAATCRWPPTSTPRSSTRYREYGLSLGFKMVFSGPLVRSSYMADAGQRGSAAGAVLNWVLALALGGAAHPHFPRFHIVWLAPWRWRRCWWRPSRDAAVPPLSAGLGRGRGLSGSASAIGSSSTLAVYGGLGNAGRLGRLPAVLR